MEKVLEFNSQYFPTFIFQNYLFGLALLIKVLLIKKRVSLAPSVLFFTFLVHLIVFFLLRYCINARTHALTGSCTHGDTLHSADFHFTQVNILANSSLRNLAKKPYFSLDFRDVFSAPYFIGLIERK